MPRTDAPAPPTAVARTDSPLGPIELRARRGALTGLRFVGAWPLAPAPLAPVPLAATPGAPAPPAAAPLAAATVATGAPADAVQFAGPAAGGVRAGTAVDRDVLDAARRQLDEYFAGRRRRWALAVEPGGTPFQRAVWAALERLPYGTTTTYGALAAELGRPGAARAVGAANGRNPISVVVPCHRVVGAGAGLTGYAWGLERKAWLLALERDG